MPNASKAVDTQYRDDCDYSITAASGQTFYKGTLVGINAAGLAGNISATFSKVVGVAYAMPDAPGGANANPTPTVGGERIVVRRGCHRFKTDASILPQHVGTTVRAMDDQTIGATGGICPAGVLEQVDADGWAWVDLSFSRASVSGAGII